jgi:predicted dehydrogenase
VTELGIAMVGHAFMGAAHSQAWRVAPRFFDLPVRPVMSVLCGRDADRTRAAADRLGWAEAVTDWKSVLDRDDVHVVDICTPGDTHAEIAVAALDAGKHVLCEKPMANSVTEAVAMAEAAERAAQRGVRAMVGFSYRRVPALGLAAELVAQGRLGKIHHVRAQYLQDWIVDPAAPLSWRLDKEKAGSGALGDIGAHVVDAAQFILGDTVAEVTGTMETFVSERPMASSHSGLSGTAATGQTGPVTVDDAALFLARFAGGALGSFEATRFANGR